AAAARCSPPEHTDRHLGAPRACPRRPPTRRSRRLPQLLPHHHVRRLIDVESEPPIVMNDERASSPPRLGVEAPQRLVAKLKLEIAQRPEVQRVGPVTS